MRIAQLDVGDRSFYLPPGEVDHLVAAAAAARASGEWLEFHDAEGHLLRLLLPLEELLVLHEYETEELEDDPMADANDWRGLDYDL